MTTDELLKIVKELGGRIELRDGTPMLVGISKEEPIKPKLLPVLRYHRDEIIRRLTGSKPEEKPTPTIKGIPPEYQRA